jgi:hypothetical protein
LRERAIFIIFFFCHLHERGALYGVRQQFLLLSGVGAGGEHMDGSDLSLGKEFLPLFQLSKPQYRSYPSFG